MKFTPEQIVMLVSNIGIGSVIALLLIWKIVGALVKILAHQETTVKVLEIMQKQLDTTLQGLLNAVNRGGSGN